MRRMKIFLMVFACLLVSFPALAQEDAAASAPKTGVEHFVLEKPHTQILFFADHLGFSLSNGRFTDFDGTFTLDYDDLANSSVDVTVKTASIEMGDEAWNTHMKNDDFLNVEAFPEMHFVSQSVELVDGETAHVHGNLTLLGIERPLTLHVKHNKSGIHPFNGKVVSGFTVEGEVRRSDYGMTFGLPLLGDIVKIQIQVEGHLDTAGQDASAAEE